MNRNTASLLLFCAISLVALSAASAITIPTVPVGNADNAADQNYNGQGQFGAVAYAFRVGTAEVTNSQYAEFLNAKAASDPLGLYSASMGSNVRGGITQSGVNGSYTYASKPNTGDKPVIAVNWYDAIRFANWLHNGQGNGDTETGSYTLGPLGPQGIPIDREVVRNAGATWVLPSENEWYKAAYYQPAAQGGDVDNYWLFPTASNVQPTLATANAVGDISNPGPNVANTQRAADWNGQDGNVTTVGSAGPLSRSFYGTSDQGGNLSEWNEGSFFSVEDDIFYAGQRGGSWRDNFLFAHGRGFDDASFGRDVVGFRVAMVPEPSSLVLAALGLIGFAAWGLR